MQKNDNNVNEAEKKGNNRRAEAEKNVNNLEEEMKKFSKKSFFKKVWISIKDFDKYDRFARESLGKAFIYLLQMIAIFAIVVTIISVYEFSKTVNDTIEYYQNNISDLSYQDGTLSVNNGTQVDIFNENGVIQEIIIDTSDLSEEKVSEYTKMIENQTNGIVLLKDKIILKNSSLSAAATSTYTELLKNKNVDTLNKESLLSLFYQYQNQIYGSVIFTSLFSNFLVDLAGVFVDAIVLAAVGFVISRIAKMNIKYKAVFNMSIHAYTLPVILNLAYIIIQEFTGFEIKLFSVMYTAIACIYMITAILMIKSDFIKNTIELQKIQAEQDKIREEAEAKEQEKLDEEKKKQEEQEKKKQKDKEEKENKKNNKKENNKNGKKEDPDKQEPAETNA